MHNASLLEGELACAPHLRAAAYIYLHLPGGAYFRHDPRLVMLHNTLDAPAHESLTTTVGEGDGSHALTAEDLDASAAAVADAPNIHVLGAHNGQYWNGARRDTRGPHARRGRPPTPTPHH